MDSTQIRHGNANLMHSYVHDDIGDISPNEPLEIRHHELVSNRAWSYEDKKASIGRRDDTISSIPDLGCEVFYRHPLARGPHFPATYTK